MKINFFSILALCFFLTYDARAQSWPLDTNNWNALTPFCDSQMTISNGSAYFLNRGILISSSNFPTTYQIIGSFKFAGNTNDQFQINLRTDGTLQQPANNFALGLYVYFGGGDNGLNGIGANIGIQDDIAGTFVNSYYLFNTNTVYNFRIIDTGDSISLFFTNSATPFLQLSTTNRQGGGFKIDMENSRGTCGGNQNSDGAAIALNSFTVQQILPVGYITANANGSAGIGLAFQTQTNSFYFVQTSQNLTSWTNFDGPFLGDGLLFYKIYSMTNQNQLFYRFSATSFETR